jgi:hypothetical protein
MEGCARAARERLEVAGGLTWQRGGSVAWRGQREEGIDWASSGGSRVL